MIKTFKIALIAAATLGAFSMAAPTTASAHPIFYTGGHWHAGFWGPRYRVLRYWAPGVVLRNGCPIGYVRDGGLCFPTF